MITHYCSHFSSFDILKSRRMTQVARTGGRQSVQQPEDRRAPPTKVGAGQGQGVFRRFG